MSKLERITVTMPEEMAAKLRDAVEAGAYATTSEIVREAVRDWSADRDRRDAENAEIREILAAARASGRRTPDEVRNAVLNRIAEIDTERAGYTA